jgi:uncharacterized protein (TIGR00661 family)
MKILYGVPGEGMGHATRSKEVISFLLTNHHDVQIVSSHKAFQYLTTKFPGRVHEIKGLHFGFKDGKVSKWETFLLNLKKGPKSFLFNFREFLKIEKSFHPDLVISDFESFSWAFAKLHRIPFISIDNMQVMDRCRIDIKIPSEEKKNYLLAKNIVKAKVPAAKKYFITGFFPARAAKKNSILVPPIIRTEIQRAARSVKNHILVYQSTGSPAQLKKVLTKFPAENFIVYGANKNEMEGNIQFKAFSEEGFVNDFASCKAVIANGGFSFLSEAVYLRKPVYSFPLAGQFEQFINAACVDKCGFGKHGEKLNEESLREFLGNLKLYSAALDNYKQEGNSVLFGQLESFINAA